MSKKVSPAQKRAKFRFNFTVLRNISAPEDLANDRKVYSGQAPIDSILDLTAIDNVRDYLPESSGKQKRVYTSVHKAIKDTLLNDSENFSVLNGGIVIVARDLEVDEKEKFAILYDPSIINGAQTQGVINDLTNIGSAPINTNVKYELIVTQDEELIGEVSISRNYQNDVLAVSIAGRRGQFDEIEKSVQKEFPHFSLRKSESEYPDNESVVDTEKLLQVLTALTPQELWFKAGESDDPNKVYTYSMKARCLKEFQDIQKRAKSTDPEDDQYRELYQYYLDLAPVALNLYYKWKKHQGFNGTGLRSIERGSNREILDVPDGIIFPILSALSVFVEKRGKKWTLSVPPAVDKHLISTAKRSYQEIAKSNPQTMGKNKACYSSLLQITSLYKNLVS